MIAVDDKYKVYDEKYEYPKTELSGKESKYIRIPWSLISNTELDLKRVGIFSYLKMSCRLDDTIIFSAPDMIEWCGGKPDNRINGSNDRFLDIVDILQDKGFLTHITERNRSGCIKSNFNVDFYDECIKKGYSVIYLDEIEKILNYKSSVISTTVLLVFAYLRYKIIRRPNELKIEERYPEWIKDRRERCPEAYNGNIKDMAEEIGISQKTFLKAIDILEFDLKLIVTATPYRIRNVDDEFRTPPSIFAFTYKRENDCLLVSGDDYIKEEIELKINIMRKYFKNYSIKD